MTNNKTAQVLSPGYAMALGDVLAGVCGNAKIEWLSKDGDILKGEMRSIVMGENNFASMPFGTDVREGYVWITSSIVERTESIDRLVHLAQEGGLIINGR